MRSATSRWVVVVGSIALLASAACGSDEPSEATSSDHMSHSGSGSVDPVANACPTEGCSITITDAAASGDEIEVTWEANFVPDVSKNHIHIFWDIYEPEEVSSDAEANDLVQGEWVPTDSVPTYVTEGAVSVQERGDSTTLCATAGDRDHAVIDPSIVDCFDVSDLLP
ncbi:MAG: hypothetical protein WBM72_11680 [Actinomycetota bacterium]